MSSPVVTALPDDTVAAGRRAGCATRRSASVVVVDGERPIGILTERDLVRWGAAGVDPGASKVAEWMTADPDTVAPDAVGAGGLRLAGVARLPPHPGRRRRPARRHRVDARPAAGGVDPARRAPVARSRRRPGLEGVIVAETEVGDVRGLEGFYHYRQYSPSSSPTSAASRTSGTCCSRARCPTAARARRVPRRDPPAAAPCPTRSPTVLPAIAAGVGSRSWTRVRTAVSLVGAVEGYRPTLDIDHAERRRNALQMCAVIADPHHRRSTGCAAASQPIEPRDDLGYGANYLWMMHRRGARPGQGPRPSSSTRSRRSTTASTPRRSPPGSSPRPAPTSPPPSSAASAPCRARCTAARRQRALDLLDAIGTAENARPYLGRRRHQRREDHGVRPPRLQDRRPPLAVPPRRRRAHRRRQDRVRQGRSSRPWSTCSPSSSRAATSTPTSSSTPAWSWTTAGCPRELFTPTFASSRVIGWCANILEQAADNRIIRPSRPLRRPAAARVPVPDAE